MTLWEARAGAGYWQDLQIHEERIPGWSRFAGRTCDFVGEPMLEQSIPKGQYPVDRAHTKAVCEEL